MYLQTSSTCSEKFPFNPHLPFAFEPVKPKLLAEWEALLVLKVTILLLQAWRRGVILFIFFLRFSGDRRHTRGASHARWEGRDSRLALASAPVLQAVLLPTENLSDFGNKSTL